MADLSNLLVALGLPVVPPAPGAPVPPAAPPLAKAVPAPAPAPAATAPKAEPKAPVAKAAPAAKAPVVAPPVAPVPPVAAAPVVPEAPKAAPAAPKVAAEPVASEAPANAVAVPEAAPRPDVLREMPVGVGKEGLGQGAVGAGAILAAHNPAYEVPARADRPIGTIFVQDDEVFVQRERFIEPHDVDARHLPRVRQLIALRKAGRDLLNAELMSAPDAEITRLRAALNVVYDRFVADFGPINHEPVGTRREGTRVNLVGFEEDPDCAFVSALEIVLPDGAGYEKAEIFTQTVVRPIEVPTRAETPTDALLLSLDHRGRVDMEFIAGLLEKTVAEAEEALAGQVFLDPSDLHADQDPAVSTLFAPGGGVRRVRFSEQALPGRYTIRDTPYGPNRATWQVTRETPRGDAVVETLQVSSEGADGFGAQDITFPGLGLTFTTTPDYQAGAATGRTVQAQPAWAIADIYLSGRVRSKLAQATRAAETDPRFAANIEGLRRVQPVDLTPEEITPALGASWIPARDIEEFVAHLFNRMYTGVRVEYAQATGAWTVRVEGDAAAKADLNGSPVSIRTFGTERMPLIPFSGGFGSGTCLLETALNNREIRIKTPTEDGRFVTDGVATAEALDRLEDLRSRFAAWVWEDRSAGGRTERLTAEYNKRMNDWVERRFTWEHKTFPGLNQAVNLEAHQRHAVARIEMGGNTLLAHEVGTGKTFIMGAAAMEARRLGRARKPCITVPNNRLYDTARELQHLYPNARILVAGGEQASKRRIPELAARIATSDVDIVVMPHQVFSGIPLSTRTRLEIARQRLAEVNGLGRTMAAAEETARNSLRRRYEGQIARLTAALEQEAVGGVFFDELGIDMILVDEAHNFKNVTIATKNRGLGFGKGSAMGDDLVEKLGYIDFRTPNRNAVLATGTPIANSLAEVFIYQMMMHPRRMLELGVANFDNWVSTFAEASPDFEITASGLFRLKTRLRKFKNVGDLVAVFTEFADMVQADDVGVERPAIAGGAPIVVRAPGGPLTRAMLQDQIARAEEREAGRPREGDSLFKQMADATKLAMDPRLLDATMPREDENKVPVAARTVFELSREVAAERGLVLVFCDASTFGKDGEFAIYPALVEELQALGMPRSEIGIMQEAKTEQAKERLLRAAREGRIRVLIGSTATLGTGSNVQDRVFAITHLDLPWRPDWLEQRNGRGQRRGNRYKEVKLVHVVTEGSSEAFRGQRVMDKATPMQQLHTARRGVRSIEEVEPNYIYATAAVLRASASSDQRVMRMHELETEVRALTRRVGAEERSMEEGRRFLMELPRLRSRVEHVESRLADVVETAAARLRDRQAAETPADATPDLFAAAGEPLPEVAAEDPATEGWDFSETLRAYSWRGVEVGSQEILLRTVDDAVAHFRGRLSARSWDQLDATDKAKTRRDAVAVPLLEGAAGESPVVDAAATEVAAPVAEDAEASVGVPAVAEKAGRGEKGERKEKVAPPPELLNAVVSHKARSLLMSLVRERATFPGDFGTNAKDSLHSHVTGPITVGGVRLALRFSRIGQTVQVGVPIRAPQGLDLLNSVGADVNYIWSKDISFGERSSGLRAGVERFLLHTLPEELARVRRELSDLAPKAAEWEAIIQGRTDTRDRLRDAHRELSQLRADLGIGEAVAGNVVREMLVGAGNGIEEEEGGVDPEGPAPARRRGRGARA